MFGIARARTAAGPDEALLFNAEFTAPQRGALQPTAFVAAFCERRPFLPQHGCSKTVLQMRANNTWRSQTSSFCQMADVAALVRARKKTQTWELGLHAQPRRAVPHMREAPYLNSASPPVFW